MSVMDKYLPLTHISGPALYSVCADGWGWKKEGHQKANCPGVYD